MKGRVLGFSADSGTGVISGQDGKRYAFQAGEWKAGQPVRAGLQVDFEPQDDVATGIYAEPGGIDLSAISGIDMAALKGSAGAEKIKKVLTSSLAVPLSIVLLIACAMPALSLQGRSVSLFDLTEIMGLLSLGDALSGGGGSTGSGFETLLLLRFFAPILAVVLLWRAWVAQAPKMIVLATGSAAILAFVLIEMIKLGLGQGNDLSAMIGQAISTGFGTWLILLSGIGLILTGLGIVGNPAHRES